MRRADLRVAMGLGRKTRRQAEAKDDRLGLDFRVVGIAHDIYDVASGGDMAVP